MLHRASCKDAELASTGVLMRGMRAAIVLNLHRPMPVVTIERIRILEGMAIGILQSEVLVEHRVVIVKASEVESCLRRERMMS